MTTESKPKKQLYTFTATCNGSWTRRRWVEATSEKEALLKIEEGEDPTIDFEDDFTDAECHQEWDSELEDVEEI